LRVTFEGKDLPYEYDTFAFNSVDATGTTFPWMITIYKNGTVHQLHPLAECNVNRIGDSWTATLLLPSLLWNRDPRIEPRFVYIYRTVGAHDDPTPAFRYDWPPHEQFPRIRLNIYNYQGNFCGKLIG